MRNQLLLTTVLILSSLTAHAEAPKCHTEGNYVVMEQPVPDDNVGTNFTIYKKAKPNEKVDCPIKKAGTWTIPNQNAEYYLGQKGNMLVLDSGASAQGRSLIIWDLSKRKEVKNFEYAGEAKIKGSDVVFWLRSNDKVTDKNCPNLKELEKAGLDKAIDYKAMLNLNTLKVKKTNITQCSGVS